MMARVTIEQVADQAGVSRATAARILNSDVQYLRPAFAKRAEAIRRLARRMGYRPNAAAKAISTGRFRHVGLVMGTHYERSHFTREMIRGIHDALHERGMHLSLWFLNDAQLNDECQLPVFLREQMLDGLLINYTHAIPPHMSEAIRRSGLPVIWVNAKRPAGCVYPDDMDAGRRAVEFCVGLGHRRIAFADFVHGPENDFPPHYSVEDREAGYVMGMVAAGLTPTFIRVPRLLTGAAAVARAVESLRTHERPTAVVCQSPRDVSVFEVAAAHLGLPIPAQLSLITFGGQRQNSGASEPTLLVEPREALGRAAIIALLGQIDAPHRRYPPRRIPYTLQVGETTAAAPVSGRERPRKTHSERK